MIIKVDNLSKSFSYYKKKEGLKNSLSNLFHREQLIKHAVRNISFEIGEGEIVGFLGPNGAGKTTTLKMLSGILFPSEGTASVLGFTPWERKKAFKKQFSIVMGQKGQLWWDLPAKESFILNKYIYEIDSAEFERNLQELAELLDVEDLMDIQVRRLSLGERMKMELIASLIHKPKILFLDEPTIGLDIISQKKIREFIKYYNQQEKTTVILTSHYMNDVEDLCKRTIVINEGTIAYDGELARINDMFSSKKLIKLKMFEPVQVENVDMFGTIKEFNGFDVIIETDKEYLKEYSKRILDELPVLDFNIEDIPIEEGITLLYEKGGKLDEEPSKV